MKIYYYLIISVGIMLTLGLAGIEGVGTNINSLFINNGSIIQPTTEYNGSIADIDSASNDLKSSSNNLWTKFLIALLAIGTLGAITGVQVLGSGVSFDIQSAIRSLIAYGLFGLFVSDMWSLVTLTFSYGVNAFSWFLAILISVYVVGFAVSALEFVGGSD